MSKKDNRRKKGKAGKEVRVSNKHERDVAIATAFTVSENKKEIYKEFIKWGGISVTSICATISVFFISGKTTITDISVSGNIESDIPDINLYLVGATVISFVFGIACLSISKKRRKLMEEKVEQLSGPKRDEELAADPARSSSNLTHAGTTPERTHD